jgi:hypothetical protein
MSIVRIGRKGRKRLQAWTVGPVTIVTLGCERCQRAIEPGAMIVRFTSGLHVMGAHGKKVCDVPA